MNLKCGIVMALKFWRNTKAVYTEWETENNTEKVDYNEQPDGKQEEEA